MTSVAVWAAFCKRNDFGKKGTVTDLVKQETPLLSQQLPLRSPNTSTMTNKRKSAKESSPIFAEEHPSTVPGIPKPSNGHPAHVGEVSL
ncbi:hypothetical protein BC938DRAFT_470880 [Jimgerdemannia flammicorona]|uniref:Uncharacterized protein n=1 Tax=Jimgerdemannia flammicorona TaxID=994334 RepID=A0A433Q991_9FUNG|nr:hypothetical protein BC938DRAFT_470880 [Jimgerdemannia flammicorona]